MTRHERVGDEMPEESDKKRKATAPTLVLLGDTDAEFDDWFVAEGAAAAAAANASSETPPADPAADPAAESVDVTPALATDEVPVAVAPAPLAFNPALGNLAALATAPTLLQDPDWIPDAALERRPDAPGEEKTEEMTPLGASDDMDDAVIDAVVTDEPTHEPLVEALDARPQVPAAHSPEEEPTAATFFTVPQANEAEPDATAEVDTLIAAPPVPSIPAQPMASTAAPPSMHVPVTEPAPLAGASALVVEPAAVVPRTPVHAPPPPMVPAPLAALASATPVTAPAARSAVDPAALRAVAPHPSVPPAQPSVSPAQLSVPPASPPSLPPQISAPFAPPPPPRGPVFWIGIGIAAAGLVAALVLGVGLVAGAMGAGGAWVLMATPTVAMDDGPILQPPVKVEDGALDPVPAADGLAVEGLDTDLAATDGIDWVVEDGLDAGGDPTGLDGMPPEPAPSVTPAPAPVVPAPVVPAPVAPAPRPSPGPAPVARPVPVVAPAPAPAPDPEPVASPGATPTVKLVTDPPALRVEFDGVALGRTPMKLEIPPGDHVIVLDDGKSTGRFPVNGSNVPSKLCFTVVGRRIEQSACQP